MMTNQNIVLMAVLECGTMDLGVLDGIEYDLEDIVDDLLAEGIKPTLNAITDRVFYMGAAELGQYLSDRICELEAIPNERDLGDEEEAELAALHTLNVDEDIEWYCNCLDTHIWFSQHEDVYRKYLPEAVEAVEENMGFEF